MLTLCKGFSKKRCFVTIFLGFFAVFSINFLCFSVVIQLIDDYSYYSVVEYADNIAHIQFNNDKQEYDINLL